jgi:hypothetical protein
VTHKEIAFKMENYHPSRYGDIGILKNGPPPFYAITFNSPLRS